MADGVYLSIKLMRLSKYDFAVEPVGVRHANARMSSGQLVFKVVIMAKTMMTNDTSKRKRDKAFSGCFQCCWTLDFDSNRYQQHRLHHASRFPSTEYE
jgi:hypothetical protein